VKLVITRRRVSLKLHPAGAAALAAALAVVALQAFGTPAVEQNGGQFMRLLLALLDLVLGSRHGVGLLSGA
jgi:hypothetical protein